MEFSDKVLKEIEQMGMYCYSISKVACKLNMTPDELRNERFKNKKLDDALKRYEFNAEAYFVDRMMKAVISKERNLIAEIYVALYAYLSEKNGTW